MTKRVSVGHADGSESHDSQRAQLGYPIIEDQDGLGPNIFVDESHGVNVAYGDRKLLCDRKNINVCNVWGPMGPQKSPLDFAPEPRAHYRARGPAQNSTH